MLPLLKERRDIVRIESKDVCDFAISDVVLFKRGEQLVLHRIISKNGSKYEIIGDNQYVSEMVHEQNIIGIMTAFLRDGKEVMREDADYQKYVKKIMGMSMRRRRIISFIRRII